MIVDKSVPKKYIIWVLYCNYHHVNLKYFLHSDDWLPWQQPLPFGLKNVILGCVIVSSIERINMIKF
jgi:hypothetical protein